MDIEAVEAWLRGFQERLCARFEALDGSAHFGRDPWNRAEGGGGISRVLADGGVFERGGVGFSLVHGSKLPPSASAHRPELQGRSWRAMGVSVVMHPRNPHAPTSHCNVRLFVAEKPGEAPVWWFGGGFDLTPYYGYDEDCRDWHGAARDACAPAGEDVYPRLKRWCDDYFFLKHRHEPRGIGGIFYDDWSEGGFEAGFALMQRVAEAYGAAYAQIVERRRDTPYGEPERQWQLLRRGRYVEFNLVWDRGTLFGLQSGGRSESILMSMPPLVRWEYDHRPEPGSCEAELLERYLVPRDWA